MTRAPRYAGVEGNRLTASRYLVCSVQLGELRQKTQAIFCRRRHHFGNGQTRLKELFYCAFSSIRGAAVGSNPNSCGPLPDGRPVKVTARLWPVIVTAIFWPEIARLIHRHAPSPVVIPTATATICGFRDRCHDG